MADSFAPTALFLDCSHLYHKLRASYEALACGYCGIAATPRLRVGAAQVGGLVPEAAMLPLRMYLSKYCYATNHFAMSKRFV